MILLIELSIEFPIELPYCIAYCIACCIAYCSAYCIAWGGEGVISCTPSITFHLVARKIYIYSSILTFRYASFGDDEIGKIFYR